jgi:hypothetical protein
MMPLVSRRPVRGGNRLLQTKVAAIDVHLQHQILSNVIAFCHSGVLRRLLEKSSEKIGNTPEE